MNEDFTADLLIEEKPDLVRKAKLGVPSVLMIIFVFAMSAFGSLVQLDFDIKQMTQAALLALVFSVGLRVAVYFCSRWVGASTRYQRDEFTEDVTKAKDAYIADITGLPIADFSAWADEENRKEKERVYRDRCNAAILALERKILFIKKKPRNKPMGKREKLRLAKLEHRQEDIRARVTDEYIEENLAYIRVKYDHIAPADFMEGNHLSAHPRKKYGFDASQEISRDTVKDIPVMLLCSFGVALITTNVIFGTINIAAMVFDLGSGVMNFCTGWYFIGAKNTAKAIAVYNNKRAVVSRFKGRKIEE